LERDFLQIGSTLNAIFKKTKDFLQKIEGERCLESIFFANKIFLSSAVDNANTMKKQT
jgi:hypothetical protein